MPTDVINELRWIDGPIFGVLINQGNCFALGVDTPHLKMMKLYILMNGHGC